MLYGFALGNTPQHLSIIETDIAHYAVAEVQFEMWRSRLDSDGMDLIPSGLPPAWWLHDHGVDVWSYIHPQFTYSLLKLGKSDAPPLWNQFYWRRELARMVEENDWYCKCKDGSVSDKFYDGLMPTAMHNSDYRNWVVNRILEELEYAGTRQLRFDMAFLQPQGYIRCPITCGDAGFNAGLFAMWDALRSDGVRVVANGAWEMSNPSAPSERWEFPAMKHLDGVMAEAPRSGKWDERGRWWGLTDERLMDVARAWIDADKIFIIVATYNPQKGDDKRFGSFENFARHYYDLARDIGCHVAINHRQLSGNYTPWLDWYEEERKPSPLIPPEPDPGLGLDDALRAGAEVVDCLNVNPDAALFRAMRGDGYVPTSPEFELEYNGVRYVAQRAERELTPLQPRVYYVVAGDWRNVTWILAEDMHG